ncbi:hypothetical protein Y032_0373g194 [Ancylostoma ceylanicum]|uniref:Uncharacterized protein n=1 Tax=Ancylostoma ceylanicum TaxID=53326 RepID=A0A016RUP8_9BILA|nr:hypothetical protein Y032_0373g194 [Ancylostoma ceylanicum]
MSSGFGEYIWLVENHPQLISTMDHFECIMDSIPLMTKCVDIRPLHRTLTVIPRFLSRLSIDERDSWVGKNLGRYQSLEVGRSWLQLIRNAEKEEDLALELTVQFFFCSVKYGAEEFLGALLDNVSQERKVMAIKSIELMPHSLHSTLIPDHCTSAGRGLYEAIERMTEEMPVMRFKSDGVFIIEKLCEHCSLSPSRLLSEVFFPMMSTTTKGKSAIAISSLVKHEVFTQEVLAGSTVSLTNLVTFVLKHYEPPVSSASSSKYLFIEAVLQAVDTLLRENEVLKVDFSAVFDDLKSLQWYQAFVILNLFFHDDVRAGVSIKYPWRDRLSTCDTAETFCEVPLILTSWPGNNSVLFEKFLIGR